MLLSIVNRYTHILSHYCGLEELSQRTDRPAARGGASGVRATPLHGKVLRQVRRRLLYGVVWTTRDPEKNSIMAPNASSEPPTRKNSLSCAADNDDDWLTLLSEYRAAEYRGVDQDEAVWSFDCSEDEFQAEWDWLEEQLADRWARLDKICQDSVVGGTTTNRKPNFLRGLYLQQMRRRELEVAQLKRDELLQYFARSLGDKKNGKHKTNSPVGNSMDTVSGAGNSSNSGTWLWNIWESIIFEMNSTLPAILSMLFYNILMISVFDLVEDFWGMLRGQSAMIESSFTCLAMLVGGTLLYSTGDLGWWLNDRDHDHFKFDLHNRVRLPGWYGARFMHAVRYYLPVRWLVFLLGYNCCYQASQHLFELGEVVWNQSEKMLRNLPSNNFDVNLFQTVDEAMDDDAVHIHSIFLCERTCQQEIDRREAASAEILRADQEYTERALAASSHSSYWFKWALHHTEPWYYRKRPEAPPVFDPTGDLLYYFVVVVFCILILRCYGFAFWERY